MASDRTLIHAVVGAVVGIALSFLPFSTVIGGAVAGFLEGPDARAGAIVGTLAGVISFLPVAAVGAFLLGLLGFGMGIVAAPFEGFAVAAFAVLAVALIVLLYTVGFALFGGYLGAVLAREYPKKRRETRRSLGMASDSHPGRVPPSRLDSRRRSADRDAADDRSTGRDSPLGRAHDWARDGHRDRDRDPFDADPMASRTDRRREDRDREPERDRERERDE